MAVSTVINETKCMFHALAANLKAPYPVKRAHYDFTRDLIQVRHLYPHMDTRQLSYVHQNYYALAQIMSADFGYDDPFPYLDTILRIAGHLPQLPTPIPHPVSITVDDESSVGNEYDSAMSVPDDETPIAILAAERSLDNLNIRSKFDGAITETETEVIINAAAIKGIVGPNKRIVYNACFS